MSACCGRVATSTVWSASRSGYSTFSLVPRSPPKPPSPRAKMPDRAVHNFSPSADTVSDSWMITAAEPLSWISAIFVVVVAVPSAGIGRCRRTDWLPCTTLARSISTPGNDTRGASVTFIVAATVANEGSTFGAVSWMYSSPVVSIGSPAAPTPSAYSATSEAVQENSCEGSSAPSAVFRSIGTSDSRLLGGGGIRKDVIDSKVADHHRRAEGGARYGVGEPHNRRGCVPGSVDNIKPRAGL